MVLVTGVAGLIRSSWVAVVKECLRLGKLQFPYQATMKCKPHYSSSIAASFHLLLRMHMHITLRDCSETVQPFLCPPSWSQCYIGKTIPGKLLCRIDCFERGKPVLKVVLKPSASCIKVVKDWTRNQGAKLFPIACFPYWKVSFSVFGRQENGFVLTRHRNADLIRRCWAQFWCFATWITWRHSWFSEPVLEF